MRRQIAAVIGRQHWARAAARPDRICKRLALRIYLELNRPDNGVVTKAEYKSGCCLAFWSSLDSLTSFASIQQNLSYTVLGIATS